MQSYLSSHDINLAVVCSIRNNLKESTIEEIICPLMCNSDIWVVMMVCNVWLKIISHIQLIAISSRIKELSHLYIDMKLLCILLNFHILKQSFRLKEETLKGYL